jgi:hypothetical protein
VIGPCPLRIEREVELVFPPELEARLGQGLVPEVGGRVTLGQIGGVGGNLVGDDPLPDIVLVGQT